MGIFDWIKNNVDKILIGVGLITVLFWPKVKDGLALLQDSAPPPASGKPSSNCCACPPEEPEHDDASKEHWVVRTMEIRAYCLDHKLDDGTKLCEDLIAVLVAAKPKKTIIVTKEV